MTPREKILRDAVEFYADKESWHDPEFDVPRIKYDQGLIARDAIKEADAVKAGMTPREEAQLTALEEIRCPNVKELMPGVWDLAHEAIEKCKEIKAGPDETIDSLKSELIDRIRHAFGNLEDSDVVYADLRKMLDLIESSKLKDGPSEKDRRGDIEWLRFVEDGLPDEYPDEGQLGSNVYFDLKRALRKLKKYMGIE